ncbi:DUF445 domain-containing protein [Halobacillus litoralis]|uniref:DUF445 domain-containing protein n=1 Tax=Halobacillus litoralis TaxID=45668 RepID=A0A410MAF4_9BACI|nr:DUF445 family protein [Halobacillus litoralis]QAS51714.1 DUF445 domain-containing protein [Halobacillus litoralis]
MNPVMLILLMVGVGALIGGLTNSLAIKMLFRPYRAIHIGNYRLPLTPGLIPKRQKELAQQLGKMVVNHLLTPEGIRRKLAHPDFQNQMTGWAQEEVRTMIQQDKTVEHLLESFDIEVTSDKLKANIAEWVEGRYHSFIKDYRGMKVEELLSLEWREKSDEGVDQVADHIQQSIEQYFRSTEGREKVAALIDNYLDNQGFLGNMLTSFMGSDGLTERIYPVILRYVSDREMNEWLKTMLHTEKDKLMQQPIGFFEEKVGAETISHVLGQAVAKSLPVEEWMSRSVAEWSKPYEQKILQEFVPLIVKQSSEVLSSKIENMMSTMRLSEIVQEEVEAFQVERLEEMVLGISRREFKMITYLGALLGGMIGFLQAIIVLFFG